jgi:signal peptidase II
VIIVTILTVFADQLTKHLVLRFFEPGSIKPVIPGFFNLTLTFNPGAAFGLWTGLPEGVREVVLGLTIVLALGVVLFFLRQPTYRSVIGQSALAAILGGAIGNIVDRFVHGSVVDFLDFYIGTNHWPAFNIADSAICVGVVALILLPNRSQAPGKA